MEFRARFLRPCGDGSSTAVLRTIPDIYISPTGIVGEDPDVTEAVEHVDAIKDGIPD
jgi:hypothetical protein